MSSLTDSIIEAVSKVFPRGTAEAPEYLEFFRSSAEFVRNWFNSRAGQDMNQLKPFMIAYSAHPYADELANHFGSERFYKADISTNIGGKILLTNINLQQMQLIENEFSKVSEILTFVETSEQSAHPFLIVYPAQNAIAIRLPDQAIGNVEAHVLPRETGDGISSEQVKRWLNVIHVTQLRGPNAPSNLSFWKDPEKYETIPQLERAIQSAVNCGLVVVSQQVGGDSWYETNLGSGRCDIVVVHHKDGAIRYHVIEIKALRQKKSSAFNEKWVKRGIRQANGYRNSIGPPCDSALTTVYDCRKDCLALPKEAITFAEEKKIEVLHYPIFTRSNLPD